MNDNGNRYALSALRNKRAVLAGEIVQLNRQLRSRREALVHVDATLKLLDPSIKIDTIANKRPPKRVKLFRQGELGWHIMDALRPSGPKGLSTAEIATSVLKAGEHGEEARPSVQPRVRGNRAYLERRGKVAKLGDRKTTRWRLP